MLDLAATGSAAVAALKSTMSLAAGSEHGGAHHGADAAAHARMGYDDTTDQPGTCGWCGEAKKSTTFLSVNAKKSAHVNHHTTTSLDQYDAEAEQDRVEYYDYYQNYWYDYEDYYQNMAQMAQTDGGALQANAAIAPVHVGTYDLERLLRDADTEPSCPPPRASSAPEAQATPQPTNTVRPSMGHVILAGHACTLAGLQAVAKGNIGDFKKDAIANAQSVTPLGGLILREYVLKE